MAKKRKNRRIKKTKYLSLRLQFSSEKQANHPTAGHLQHQQLDLLNIDGHDDSMEYLLSASDGGATTLTGLLDSAGVVEGADELSASASVTYASETMKLVRTALRSRERESSSEERYVQYSEVVEDQRRDHEHEEVSSRVGVGGEYCYNNNEKTSTTMTRRLRLKLDYEEILNAWSDKGDLYVHSDFLQTVPDIIDITHHFSSHIPKGGESWSVPEENGGAMPKLFKTEKDEEEMVVVGVPLLGVGVGEDKDHRPLLRVGEDKDHRPLLRVGEDKDHRPLLRVGEDKDHRPLLRVGEDKDHRPLLRVGEDKDHRPEERKCQREASVLRYKEKRRNRLFSKTIRYQVRKENAQKRPRIKGRFVKRS